MFKLQKRMRWLERKIIELLRLIVGLSSILIGFEVAKETKTTGLIYRGVATGAWIVAIVLPQRMAFRDTPGRIDPPAYIERPAALSRLCLRQFIGWIVYGQQIGVDK